MSQEADLSLSRLSMVDPQIHLNEPYTYEPLLRETDIRLLILEPGTGEESLVGSIKTVDLNAPDLDSFEAISYVWGSNEKDQSILIDGTPLPITTNLREALLQTRLPERPRTLWADSVCINQDDRIEKGHQVFAMGRIYKTSRRTLICLGREPDYEDEARNAIALINDVEAMIDAVMRDPNFSGGFNSFPYPSENDPLMVDTRWLSAWNALVRHPWFKRGWVVQEAALGEDALIHWAGYHIEWMSLLKVGYWFTFRALGRWRPGRKEPRGLSRLHRDIFHHRRPREARTFLTRDKFSFSRKLTTLSILRLARHYELTDPRDRIYAFMALETADGVMAKLEIQPDYERPHPEVFYDFARRYIQESSDMEILAHVDHDEEDLIVHHGVPSWVPQWDDKTEYSSIHYHETHCKPFFLRDEQPRTTDIIHESELRLRGVFLGRIHYASRIIEDNLEDKIEEVLTLWWEVAAEIEKQPGPFRKTLGLPFLSATTRGKYTGELAVWQEAKSEFSRCLDLNDDIDELRKVTRDPPMYDHVYRITDYALLASSDRRVVVLEQGLIGVASAGARQGDLCAMINGLCTPVILRPVSGKPDHYVLIGNAFLVIGPAIDGRRTPLTSDSRDKTWIKEYLPAQEIILE